MWICLRYKLIMGTGFLSDTCVGLCCSEFRLAKNLQNRKIKKFIAMTCCLTTFLCKSLPYQYYLVFLPPVSGSGFKLLAVSISVSEN